MNQILMGGDRNDDYAFEISTGSFQAVIRSFGTLHQPGGKIRIQGYQVGYNVFKGNIDGVFL